MALIRRVGDRLEHESVRVEPERRVKMLAIFGKHPWFMKDIGAVRTRPVVDLPDDRPALNHERDVLQARSVARIGLRLECLIEDQL